MNKGPKLANLLRKSGVNMKNSVKNVKQKFSIKSSKNGQRSSLQGRDYYSPGFSVTGVNGQNLLSILINPTQLGIWRLGTEASIWSKYRFTKFSVSMQPGKGTAQDGSLIGFYDPDIQDSPFSDNTLPSTIANLQNANAHRRVRINNLNQARLVWSMPKIKEFPWYFCAPQGQGTLKRDATLIYQARFNLDIDVAPASPVSTGPIVIDWECEFSDPSTTTGSVAPPAQNNNNRISVFQEQTTNGANQILFPNGVSGLPLAPQHYYGHGDGPAYLWNNTTGSTTGNYLITLSASVTYYFFIHLFGTVLSAPTISLSTEGSQTTSWNVITGVSDAGSTTYNTFGYIDCTALTMPQNIQRVQITCSDTTLTHYSVTVFTDLDSYSQIKMTKEEKLDERLKCIEDEKYSPPINSKFPWVENKNYVDRKCTDDNCRKCILMKRKECPKGFILPEKEVVQKSLETVMKERQMRYLRLEEEEFKRKTAPKDFNYIGTGPPQRLKVRPSNPEFKTHDDEVIAKYKERLLAELNEGGSDDEDIRKMIKRVTGCDSDFEIIE